LPFYPKEFVVACDNKVDNRAGVVSKSTAVRGAGLKRLPKSASNDASVTRDQWDTNVH
jgi:hypothetical protein